MWTHCIPEGILHLPFASAHDETRECIFAAFRMPIVDARIRRDRKTWSIYYSLFQYRRCDRQRVSTSKSSSLVLFFPTLCALFALFDTEKNKKRYSTPTTPLRTRTILRSLDKKLDSLTRCVFCRRSLSSWSLFSSLVARVSMVCCASSFYISLEKEELFYCCGDVEKKTIMAARRREERIRSQKRASEHHSPRKRYY